MAELDLPTLNIQRYVDLLKRRRWQLIPFAIVGLFVGGIVAALIPRYYEAKTQVRVFGTILDQDRGSGDPFLEQMENANSIIRSPLFLKQAMEELGWPEVFAEGAAAREALSDAAERVRVRDVNPRPRRDSATIEISYRDRIAQRAEQLANKLFEVYRRREWESLEARLRLQLEKAKDAKSAAVREYGDIVDRIAIFDTTWKITSAKTTEGQKDSLTQQADRLEEVSKKIADLKAERESDAALLLDLDASIAAEQQTLPLSLDTMHPSLKDAYLMAMFKVGNAKQTLDKLNQRHPDYGANQQQLRQAEAELKQLTEWAASFAGKQQENPAYAALVQKRKALEAHQKGLDAELKVRIAEHAQLDELVTKIPDIQRRKEVMLAERNAAENKRKMLDDEYEKLVVASNKMSVTRDTFIEVLFRAYAPKSPTYPDIWLVASAGCLIGLFTAVGLVFLLDFFRSAFKTVDDAARGLPIPVLGFVSHMETPEVSQALRRRRVGWSAAAAALVLLAGSVVVLYNVDKTRLPVFVAKVLDSVLGSGKK